MKKRIITGIILAAFLVPLLLFADNFAFRLAFTGVAAIALCEIFRCVGVLDKLLLSIPLGAFAIVSLSASFNSLAAWSLMMVGVAFYCMATIVLSNRKIAFGDVGAALASTIYIIVGLSAFVLLRENGNSMFWFVLLGAWGCDIFAYLIGKFFGKKKLVPDISPNKTIAGAVAGTLSGGVLFPMFAYIIDIECNFLSIAVLGLISAIAAQIGDLIMSAVKREYNIKDFSNIFPGHGGVLDRFDSVLFVAPIIYAYSVLV